jgi:hypothetical protein
VPRRRGNENVNLRLAKIFRISPNESGKIIGSKNL